MISDLIPLGLERVSLRSIKPISAAGPPPCKRRRILSARRSATWSCCAGSPIQEGAFDSRLVEEDDILPLKTLRHKLDARPSPFMGSNNSGGGFVGDLDLVILNASRYESTESAGSGCASGVRLPGGACLLLPPWARRSGPRRQVYHDPEAVTAAIVTCGGLCPGLNNVIQGIVNTLEDYGVKQVYGVRYGLRGFYDRSIKPLQLSREAVDGIHLKGGTILGTSRGGADIKEIVRIVELWGISMLFVIGGNGGQAAANAIHLEVERRDVTCSVCGIPKSIDNDILLIDRCFGFETAVEEAQKALRAAKTEAKSAYRGLSLVRLMGRESGYITMQASLASGVVDVCLIPEIPMNLDKVVAYVGRLLDQRGHCVVAVAEGACQEHMQEAMRKDLDQSGNPVLSDCGVFLRGLFKQHIPVTESGVDLKYIDPSYLIRAVVPNSNDQITCTVLAQGAVHGAFAGYTGFTVGSVNTHYVLLPLDTVIQATRTVDPGGRSWNRLKTFINQPDFV